MDLAHGWSLTAILATNNHPNITPNGHPAKKSENKF